MEELIKRWENELIYIDKSYKEAYNSDKIHDAYMLLGQKNQLIQCISQLKNLNEAKSRSESEGK